MFSRSARFYDALYDWKDYAAESERLDRLIRARVPDARTLLDVACGTGLHLAQLATRYEAEGLDLDPELLAVARNRVPEVPLHEADMTDFSLDQQFDAVVCLFSSIGYVRTADGLHAALAAMAKHTQRDGVLVVEPWLTPDKWRPGVFGALFAETDDWAVARMNTSSEVADGLTILDMHYLVATAEGVEHFVERHELGMFTHEDYMLAFRAAGVEVEHDVEGLMGRGLYIGMHAT